MSICIDRECLIESLADLVRVNSINSRLADGTPGEVEIGEYIATTLLDLGLPAEIVEIEPSQVNVVCTIDGPGGERSLMLAAHMDTVGVEDMKQPFSAEIRDGKLYGRVAQDMNANIAAMLNAVKALVCDRDLSVNSGM